MYYLETVFHLIYMAVYYTIAVLAWTLEMVLIFVTFLLGGLFLGRML